MYELISRVFDTYHKCTATATLISGSNGWALLTIREQVMQPCDQSWLTISDDLRLVTELFINPIHYKEEQLFEAVQDAFNGAAEKRDFQRTTIDCQDFMSLLHKRDLMSIHNTEYLPADRERLMIDESDVDYDYYDPSDLPDYDIMTPEQIEERHKYNMGG